MARYSRRQALRLGTAFAAATVTRGGAAESAPRGPQPVRYAEVQLFDSPARRQFDATRQALLAMNEDALLKPFRVAAGLPAPGPDLGGWYNASSAFRPPANMNGFIPGHSFGQYLSALARAYAVTGDVATKAKVNRLVAGFAPTVTRHFYEGYPLPAYTFDKINVGLIDAHEFVKTPDALAVLNRALDAALPHLPEKALTRPEMAARPHPNIAFTWDESYTLPENLYLAWRRGAGARFRTLARRYLLDAEYFDPLSRGENVLPGKHAYSHVNALSSAMQAYLAEGSEKHLAAARNGMGFVLAQSFATGGWGPNEAFVTPGSGALGDSLDATHASFETPCGAYGHFKIARYLLAATGDSRYGDSMERVLYNTILGALPLQPDGTAFYYSDYNTKGAKTYFEYRCPCCSGTIGQIAADYGISAYFTDARGIFVNLYLPSTLNWQGARLRQTAAYPLSPDIAIAVESAAREPFRIALRIPAWAGPGTSVRVNGAPLAGPVTPGRFLAIERTWHNGDRILLSLDMPLRLEAVDDRHPNLLAVVQGPLALFAAGDRFLPFTRADLLRVRQAAPGAAEWRVQTGNGAQTFKPFFAVAGETTRLYQNAA